MKRSIIVVAVIMGLFSFGSAAMADGFSVYVDYGLLAIDQPIYGGVENFSYLTLGGEWSFNSFLLGGLYSTSLSVTPAPPDPLTSYALAVYGGYNFVNIDTFDLAVIGGYLAFNTNYDNGVEDATTSGFALGVNASLNLDPFVISARYLTAIGASSEVNGGDSGASDLWYFDVKGAYMFNDAFSMYLGYRWIGLRNPLFWGGEWNFQGFSIGLEYRF